MATEDDAHDECVEPYRECVRSRRLDYRDAIEIERRLDWIAGNLDGPAKSKILNYLHEIAELLGFDPPRP